MDKQQKALAIAGIKQYLPERLHKISLSKGSRGWITIKVGKEFENDPARKYWEGLVEGLLLGYGVIGAYLSDSGPQSCLSPNLHWEFTL